MRDAGIGRLLVASLHQGIADRLPDRLEFYENWLNPRGLRDGTIGLAPLLAVLSFLRTEGADYGTVTSAAGEYAGEWAVNELSALRQWAATRLPGPLSRRAALGVARALVTRGYTGSRTRLHVRRREADLEIHGSIFCGVRDRVPSPLCQFHASATKKVLGQLGIDAEVTIAACQATGEGACRVHIDMNPTTEVPA
jgi:hypothetical protein